MTTKLMTPVSIQIPITDAAGKPTPAFHRWLQQLSVGSLLSKTNGTVDVNSTATTTAAGVLTYFNGGGPYAWPAGSARVAFSRFLMENPDGSFVGMGGTATAGSQMFGAVDPAFTHWWNFAQISGSKYLIDGDMSYSFTLDPYVNANKIYHQGNLSFGTGLTYNAGTGVLTAGGGGGGAWTMISSQTLVVNAASVIFSSIPVTYKDLIIIAMVRSNIAGNQDIVRCQFNGDTAANYDFERENRFGVVDGFATTYIEAAPISGSTSPTGAADTFEIVITNYSGTVFHKMLRANCENMQNAAANGFYRSISSGRWKSTTAINQVTLFSPASQFIIGSVFTLYGRT